MENTETENESFLFRDEKDGILKLHIAPKDAGAMKNPKPIWIDLYELWKGFNRPSELKMKKSSLFYKALGGKETHFVLDATCGMGQDSMRMLSYGYSVLACERSPVVYALLEDALHRAMKVESLKEIIGDRFSLYQGDAKTYLSSRSLTNIDAVYLDPMYGEKAKKGRTALSRKEMQVFHHLIGEDCDASSLLQLVLEKVGSSQRIVVKRPFGAEALLTEPKVTHRYEGKSTVYDMYKILGSTKNNESTDEQSKEV